MVAQLCYHIELVNLRDRYSKLAKWDSKRQERMDKANLYCQLHLVITKLYRYFTLLSLEYSNH